MHFNDYYLLSLSRSLRTSFARPLFCTVGASVLRSRHASHLIYALRTTISHINRFSLHSALLFTILQFTTATAAV